MNKCPLQYALVRNMTSLDARLMPDKSKYCKVKFKRILRIMVEAKRVCEDDCDEIFHQYSRYLDETVTKELSAYGGFKPSELWIDTAIQNNGE